MIQPGMLIAERYEIVDTVGAGGMSVVYKALDHRLDRHVAVKVLKEEFSNDKTFVSKFRVEAQSAAGLSHPNIVNVFDVGDDQGIHYIVMELVEGITLKEYIQKKGHLSVSEAVNFSLQIASGLEVAHDNHIIHRDIKPQNIIVSPSGILKITDFGIAKAATSTTVSSNAIGSVHYISPEQARGGFSDERSDIYSLGITMYEMVTGRVPFEGDNNVTVALMHIQDEMIPPTEYYPDILPSFEKVIDKCTQKKPERRYLTANALIADLRRVEADPSGSFVKTATLLDSGETKMINSDEVKAIRDRSEQPYNKVTEPVQPKEEIEEEELDEDEMDPKMERLAKIFGVIAAVIVVLLILFLIAKFSGAFGGSKKKKTTPETTTTEVEATTTESEVEKKELPSVVGDTIDDAREKLNDAGFTNVRTEYQEDQSVDENKVISQTPTGGTEVATDDEIKLIVSKGQSTIPVPDVTGKSKDAAATLVDQEGFVIKYAYDYSDSVEEGKVISQDPKAGTSIAKGSTVTVTISEGKKVTTVKMPSVIGMSLSKAQSKLEGLGLVVAVSKAYSDTYEAGEVISQGYDKNTELKTGTSVSLTVSQGPDQTNVRYSGSYSLPDVLGVDATSGWLDVYQDGVTNPIYSKSVTHADFPYTIEVDGETSTATIRIMIDNNLVSTKTLTLTPQQ